MKAFLPIQLLILDEFDYCPLHSNVLYIQRSNLAAVNCNCILLDIKAGPPVSFRPVHVGGMMDFG